MEGPSPTSYPKTSRATTARALGIVGVVVVAAFGVLGAMVELGGLTGVGLLLALAAWYLAARELKGIAAGDGTPSTGGWRTPVGCWGSSAQRCVRWPIASWLGYSFVEAQDEVRKAEDLIQELESQPSP